VDALEEMESMRIHSLRVNELEEQLAIQIEKTKGSLGLKEDLNKKKELIKGLKDREKSLVQIIEDIRHFEEQ
jgi:DNA-directed RNA polymerase specialized sigma54-like protein